MSIFGDFREVTNLAKLNPRKKFPIYNICQEYSVYSWDRNKASIFSIHVSEIQFQTKLCISKTLCSLFTNHILILQILDRKNAEIEELKSNYRSKAKELEETISKMDRKSR